MNKMGIVITYGNFDLFHIGHVNLLRRARQLGDYLIVALSTDEFSRECKDKECAIPYEERKAILRACRHVDQVIPETRWEQKEDDIRVYKVNTFVMGDDWEGRFDYLQNENVTVVYLPRTEGISTTDIKKYRIKQ